MELTLKRIARKATYTIGRLFVDGERFCDTCEDTDRGLSQSLPLDVNKARKRKGVTAIPTGRYKVTLNVQSPRFSKKAQYAFCNGYLPRLINVPAFDGVLIHCLTPDMEILTEEGWKNMEQFNQEPSKMCYSYNTETKKAELTPINFYVENDYDGYLYCNTGGRVNYSVTDLHQMYAGYKKRDGSYIWECRPANAMPTNSVKFIAAAEKEGESLSPEMKVFYRILMAVVADGYIVNWSMNSSQVRFHFKKERKIQRIKSLLDDLGETYRENLDSIGSTHISLGAELSERITEFLNPTRELCPKKDLPWELLRLRSQDLKDLLYEYLFWDGRWENYLKCSKNMVICSTNIRTINVLQAMATLCGMRSYVRDESGGKGQRNTCFAVCLYENQSEVSPTPDTYCTIPYNGKVWCLNNDNHTLIVRKNNRPMVIGNCGNSANDTDGCILVGENKAVGKVLNSTATFKRLYARLKEAKGDIYITVE